MLSRVYVKRIMIRIIGVSPYLTVLFLLLMLSACSGSVKNMRRVPTNRIASVLEAGKSMIIFLRPSGLAYAIQSSVFEIKGDKPTLVGIIAAKKKVSYQLEPGKHLFMVIGENADFMSANLEANKTYYALISPRMGLWKARFSLQPIHTNKLKSAEFIAWLKGCERVEKTSDSDKWAISNMPSIQSKYHEYYAEWVNKVLSEKPHLLSQDGKRSHVLEPIYDIEENYDDYYSPQNAVDAFDDGENEYYSPQN